MQSLDIILSVYREEGAVRRLRERLVRVLDSLSDRYFCHILYIVGPSHDKTEAVSQSIVQEHHRAEVFAITPALVISQL